MEDVSEPEFRGKSSAPTSPLILEESKTALVPEFPLLLLQTQPKCEVYPDLHGIIQVPSELFISCYGSRPVVVDYVLLNLVRELGETEIKTDHSTG